MCDLCPFLDPRVLLTVTFFGQFCSGTIVTHCIWGCPWRAPGSCKSRLKCRGLSRSWQDPLCSCVSHLLHEQHWLLIGFWIEFRVLNITYKALHSIGPDYLRDCPLSLYNQTELKSFLFYWSNRATSWDPGRGLHWEDHLPGDLNGYYYGLFGKPWLFSQVLG